MPKDRGYVLAGGLKKRKPKAGRKKNKKPYKKK